MNIASLLSWSICNVVSTALIERPSMSATIFAVNLGA
jgi:hypothetical protein